MNKKIKSIGGLLALTAILLANLHVLSSDKVMERLLLLQNIESLAEGENAANDNDPFNFNDKELGSFLCSDGSYYQRCVGAIEYGKNCEPEEETYCPVGTEENTNVIAPGNTDIIQRSCSSLGHNWITSEIVKRCGRCGLTIRLKP